MDVKIRHKLIKIKDRVSDRFVILITNYRWLIWPKRTQKCFMEITFFVHNIIETL